MWNDIQIQCSDACEIAEALINNEVTLPSLMSVQAFMSKAPFVDDETWDLCKSRNDFNRYLAIYPNGKHVADANNQIANAKVQEEKAKWDAALLNNDMAGYLDYFHSYPNGVHAAEVDDKVWAVAKTNGTYDAYLKNFPNGKHAGEAKDLKAKQAEEEEVWQSARNTVKSYQYYVDSYPQGRHVNEAKGRIAELMREQKERIINELAEDSNAHRLGNLKLCGITANDLKGIIRDSKGNVRDEVLKSWDKESKNLKMGTIPKEIPSGNTEVYFWGVPGSGKTCAMAAILSMARKSGVLTPRPGEGLSYMNQLSSLFLADPNRPAVCLPTGSDVDTTQYLPLTLNEKISDRKGHEEIKEHKLAVVEISGEIFECFSCEAEGRPFKTDEHKNTYDQLKRYLGDNKNPKYHFFILDSKPLIDVDQMTALQNAAMYFRNKGIFNKTTQGISLIVTKCDTLSPDKNEWTSCAMKAANEYFGSLVTQLKVIVGDPKYGGLGLSDGTLKVIPLSIGEVFFQSLCLFDSTSASPLVQLLIDYSKVAETNDWKHRLGGIFRN